MGYGAAPDPRSRGDDPRDTGDVVVEGTPIELTRVLKSDKPIVNVTYELVEREPGTIARALRRAVG